MKNKKILVRDIGRHSFLEAWKYQEKIFQKIINQKVQNRSKFKKIETKNFLILTEHNHVYTIGKSGDVSNLLIDKNELTKREIEYYEINRGGDITYHGPGQLVFYPILSIKDLVIKPRDLVDVILDSLIKTFKNHNLESKKNVIEKFRKSKIAKEFERSFPDAKLIDIEEQ